MGKNHYSIKQHILSLFKYTAVCVLICALVITAGCAALPVSGETDSKALAPSPQASKSSLPQPSAAPTPEQSDAQAEPALLALDDINTSYEQDGVMTIAGMKPEDYDSAMSIEWRDLDTPGEPEELSVDISDSLSYIDIENYILNLDKYEGAEATVIGSSEQGRNIYMVKLDLGKASIDKPLIMLTGSVHAREFAGADYLIKMLNDTVVKAQKDDYTRLLLENVTIVAVPLVNPDGRELIIAGGDPLRKSNANGVDLNRAMPAVNAGQLGIGHELSEDFSAEPGMDFFAGYNLGSESETQAMIKWFNVFVPNADVYIDLHQQGGITFYNKGFISEQSDKLSAQFAEFTNDLLKSGYPPKDEAGSYGLSGVGGTLTDYAKTVAEGLVYSYSLGRFVLNADGAELPLIRFHDIDDYSEHYEPLNPDFRSICIEIGRNRKYLGPSASARRYREKEFKAYGWPKFLTVTIENMLGEEAADELRLKAKSD